MKMLSLVLALFFSLSLHASDYCNISFNTEWSARSGAPYFAKSMLKLKHILEEKGYTYYEVGCIPSGSFNLDIHKHDTKAGKIAGTLETPKGEIFTYTEDFVGYDQTVKNIFEKLPECNDLNQ